MKTNESAAKPSVIRPSKWRWRHKRAYYELTLSATFIIGLLPGLCMLVLAYSGHYASQAGSLSHIDLVMAAWMRLSVGALMVLLVGCALLLTDKVYFPEPNKKKEDE